MGHDRIRFWLNAVGHWEGIRVKEQLDLKALSLGFSLDMAKEVEVLPGFPGWDEDTESTKWTTPIGLSEAELTSWTKHTLNLVSSPRGTFRDTLYGIVYNAHLKREEEVGGKERYSDVEWMFKMLEEAKKILEAKDGAVKVDAAVQVAMLATKWLENVAETVSVRSSSDRIT